MTHCLRSVAIAGSLLAVGASQAPSQEVHEIRMVSPAKGEFRFQPAAVTARRADVLLFRSVSGGPHSVVFEAKELSADDHERLNRVMPHRAGDLSSPLLTEGSEYRVVIPALTAGTYRFFCLPHKAYDMRGQVTVR